jgi:hypothetical protein
VRRSGPRRRSSSARREAAACSSVGTRRSVPRALALGVALPHDQHALFAAPVGDRRRARREDRGSARRLVSRVPLGSSRSGDGPLFAGSLAGLRRRRAGARSNQPRLARVLWPCAGRAVHGHAHLLAHTRYGRPTPYPCRIGVGGTRLRLRAQLPVHARAEVQDDLLHTAERRAPELLRGDDLREADDARRCDARPGAANRFARPGRPGPLEAEPSNRSRPERQRAGADRVARPGKRLEALRARAWAGPGRHEFADVDRGRR